MKSIADDLFGIFCQLWFRRYMNRKLLKLWKDGIVAGYYRHYDCYKMDYYQVVE